MRELGGGFLDIHHRALDKRKQFARGFTSFLLQISGSYALGVSSLFFREHGRP